jgi:5,6-dimethylbenzimidazole synthase
VDVYEAIRTRRDIRKFRPDAVADDVLDRILEAAHQAPSVGFSQPWAFVLVRSLATRRRIKASFQAENASAQQAFTGERGRLYASLKLEGILEAPLNLCVVCDRRSDEPVLGRTSMPEMDIYSTCLAVQNLWLAARAENVGVGWVSILDPVALAQLLELPDRVLPVAYLCIGHPEAFEARPMLETVGWQERVPKESVVFEERWGVGRETAAAGSGSDGRGGRS